VNVAPATDAQQALSIQHGGTDAERHVAIQMALLRVEVAKDAEAVEEIVVVRLRLHGVIHDARQSSNVASLISSAA